MKTDIYLTSPFKHAWNREFNFVLGQKLEGKGVVCYLAHRDTNQKGAPPEIFSQDLAGMRNAKAILAVAENETPNWGAEVGFAYALKMPVIALCRQNHAIPLICGGMVTQTLRVPDLDAIDAYLEDLVALLRKRQA